LTSSRPRHHYSRFRLSRNVWVHAQTGVVRIGVLRGSGKIGLNLWLWIMALELVI
jgi:hypothetical protein